MDIEERFQVPAGWQWGKIVPREGQYLRYGWISPQNPRALVFVFPGLSEYIEKYFEVIHDLLDRNFAIAIIDWRGQGQSWRHAPVEFRHHDDFDNDVQDACALIDAVCTDSALSSLPKIMLAHSMGAHIGLRVLHDRPGLFACAAMNAPLQGIPMALDGTVLQWWLAKILNATMPTKSTSGAWSEDHFKTILDKLTTDPDRRALKLQIMRDRPDLRNGSVTYGWVYAAIKSMRMTNRASYLSTIRTPVLVTLAGREMIVSNAAIRKMTAFLPRVTTLEIPGALHEILMERDDYRKVFWHAFDALVDKNLPRG